MNEYLNIDINNFWGNFVPYIFGLLGFIVTGCEWYLGKVTYHLSQIKGESVADNVAMFRSVMEGQQGPCTDIVSLNAGAAIYVAGVAGTIKEGQTIARQCLESGSARKKMEQLIETSQLIGAEEKEQAY